MLKNNMYQSALIIYTRGEYERNIIETKLKDLACDLQDQGYYISFVSHNLGDPDEKIL